jgi:flagella basal body P-ring formation protein FlgA
MAANWHRLAAAAAVTFAAVNIRLLPLSLPALALALAGAPLAAAAQIQVDTLARAVALATEAASALAPAGARVQAQPGTLDPRLTLAPCRRVEPYLPTGVPAWGASRVGLRCVDGATRWNVFLPVTVQVWAPAAVTRMALPAGARIGDSQLQRGEADWAAASQPLYAQPEDLVGRTLARAVAAGQPLRAADLQPRLWFVLGDTVHLAAVGDGFSISTEGRALTPGLEGQPARVRTESGQIVVGRPVGDRRVEVRL